MTGQQLRNSILQEAIHGRLVPNTLQPGELTARELLNGILSARQKAENEAKGKKAKKLTLSKIDEEPWELPEGWCWCRLGDILSIKTGDKDVNFSTPNGKYNFFTCAKESYKCNSFSFSGEALILPGNGANIGICTYYIGDFEAYQRTYVLQDPTSKSLFLPYIKYVFDSNWKQYNADKMYGTAMPYIKLGNLQEYTIPLPPLSIQHSIVSKIEALLPLVEAYDAAQGELKALNESLPDKLRKSVLQEAIHGRLVPNTLQPGELTASELLDDILAARQKTENETKGKKAKKLTLSKIEEEPWELPEGWCWCRLGDVMTFVNGRAYKKEELLSQGKYKVLRVGNFFTNESWYYSDLELPEDKYCYKGDLLYAWSASFGPQIWEGDKTIFHYHIWNVRFNEDYLYKKYLYWFFEADKHIIKESTTGSTMVHVSMENMMPRFLPLPPLSIQHSIVSKIEEIFKLLEK